MPRPHADIKNPPMLRGYQANADSMFTQLSSTTTALTPDKALLKKYNTQKYQTVNNEHEPLECWVYQNKATEEIPMIEDQGARVGEVILNAARSIYMAEEEKEALEQLGEIKTQFDKKIAREFSKETTSETFEYRAKKMNQCIDQLINDVGYLYGVSHSSVNLDKLNADEYKQFFKNFYKKLWAATDEVDVSYKKNNVLVMNKAAKTVQYYERGTHLELRDLHSEEKGKLYISAHQRDKLGVPNFIAYGTGHLDAEGKPVITDIGFRHGSLPPIDLYKLEDETKKDLHAKCVDITTGNIEILNREMRLRLGNHEDDVNWLNMSLLTVMSDSENQARQYRETILGAERIRSRGELQFKPLMFDFGVNIFATSKCPIDFTQNDQIFENMRAFCQLHHLFLEGVKNHFGALPASLVELDNITRKFSEVHDNKEEEKSVSIEQDILEYAKRYDKAMTDLSRHPDDEKLIVEAKKTEQALIQCKERRFQEARDIMKEFRTCYDKKKEFFNKKMAMLNPKLDSNRDIYYAMSDYQSIVELLIDEKHPWNDTKNNFRLQAYIIDLGTCLRHLGVEIAISWNCKSNNDRSSLMAWHVDYLRALRFNQALEELLQNHYVGSAWAIATILDTLGGGPKFGARELELSIPKLNIRLTFQLDYGHPLPQLARQQEITSDWASHILEKHMKHARAPRRFMLKGIEDLKDEQRKSVLDVNVYYDTLLKKLDHNLEEYRDSKGCQYVKDFFHHNLLSDLEFHKSPEQIYKNYFVIDLICEFRKYIVNTDTIDSELKKLAMDYFRDLIHVMQPISSNRGRSSLFAAKPDLTSRLDERVKINTHSDFIETMKIGRHVWDKNSKFTKNVDKSYEKYEEALLDKSQIGFAAFKLKLYTLEKLERDIHTWLDEKKGIKGDKRKDLRLEAMQALLTKVEKEKSPYLDRIRYMYEHFIHGDEETVWKMLDDNTFKPVLTPSISRSTTPEPQEESKIDSERKTPSNE